MRHTPDLKAKYTALIAAGKPAKVALIAVLSAIGIGPDERRRVLGVSVALSEAEVHWRAFLESLQARGLRGIEYVVSDDHAGLRAACRLECLRPAQGGGRPGGAGGQLPRPRAETGRLAGRKRARGSRVFTLPEHHRRRLRTSNPIARAIQQEIKRRTIKVRVFPNEEALDRLVSAVLVEIDERWAVGTKA